MFKKNFYEILLIIIVFGKTKKEVKTSFAIVKDFCLNIICVYNYHIIACYFIIAYYIVDFI